MRRGPCSSSGRQGSDELFFVSGPGQLNYGALVNWREQCGVVIPCLNEAASIGDVVGQTRSYLPTVVVVDDGSADGTARLAAHSGARVLRHSNPMGKGA